SGSETAAGDAVITTVATGGGTGLTAPRPTILTRSQWGARAPVSAMAVGSVQGATIHHTAGTNTYTAAQVPAILRGIQSFHISGRDWSDIGYNFLVDKYGRIWEGRAGGVEKTTKGVHAAAFNGNTTGISVMGNYDTASVNASI